MPHHRQAHQDPRPGADGLPPRHPGAGGPVVTVQLHGIEGRQVRLAHDPAHRRAVAVVQRRRPRSRVVAGQLGPPAELDVVGLRGGEPEAAEAPIDIGPDAEVAGGGERQEAARDREARGRARAPGSLHALVVESSAVLDAADEVVVAARPHERVQPVVGHHVVGVAEREERTAGAIGADVAGVAGALVLGRGDHLQIGQPAGPRGGDLGGAVGRAVVHDEHLPRAGVGLAVQRLELLGEGVGAVVHRDDDGGERRRSPGPAVSVAGRVVGAGCGGRGHGPESTGAPARIAGLIARCSPFADRRRAPVSALRRRCGRWPPAAAGAGSTPRAAGELARVARLDPQRPGEVPRAGGRSRWAAATPRRPLAGVEGRVGTTGRHARRPGAPPRTASGSGRVAAPGGRQVDDDERLLVRRRREMPAPGEVGAEPQAQLGVLAVREPDRVPADGQEVGAAHREHAGEEQAGDVPEGRAERPHRQGPVGVPGAHRPSRREHQVRPGVEGRHEAASHPVSASSSQSRKVRWRPLAARPGVACG
jgi:hypothetical protein